MSAHLAHADAWKPAPLDPGATFPTAEAAWFWAMRIIIARRDPVPVGRGAEAPRCCEPEDVLAVLDRLYRARRLDRAHACVLRVYGERGEAPGPRTHAPGQDVRLWREAMALMGERLRVEGIVR